MTDRLPEGWEVAAVEDFSQTATGGTPSRKRSEYYGGDIPWVKSGDLNDGLITSVDESITELGLSSSNAKMFPKGAVCIALYGATVGKLGILDIDAATNQAVCGIFPEQGVSASYVFHALRNETSNLISQAQGGAQPNISNGIVKKTQLRLAPIAEQRRIVSKIEALQERSRKARELLTEVGPLLEQFRQSLLAAAFRGDLTADWRKQNPNTEPATELLTRIRTERRQKWEQSELAKYEAKGKQPPKGWQDKYKEPEPVDESDLPELPDGWCWITFDEATNRITDGEHATPPRTEEGVLLLSARNVLNGSLSFDKVDHISEETHQKLCERIEVVEGDVLLSCSGTVGRSCVVPTNPKYSFVRSVAILQPVLPIGAFMSLAIRSPLMQTQIESRKTQTAQSNLFQGRIKKLVMPLPSLAEQAEIVRLCDASMESIEDQEAIRAVSESSLTQLDQSVLAKAFRGELVPQDPNDEPASVLLERIRETRAHLKEKTKGKGKKTTRSPKRNTAMTKSRFDDDVKGQPYLTKLMLASTGKPTLTAEELFQIAQLPLPDFYKQLDFEVTQHMLVEREGRLEPADAT